MTDYRFEKPDIVVVAQGHEIPFWRAVLTSHSEVLARTFDHKMRESSENRVEVDATVEGLRCFLGVLHPVKSDPIDHQNVYTVLRLAHSYICPQIVERCLTTLTLWSKTPKTDDEYITHLVALHEARDFFREDHVLSEKLTQIWTLSLDAMVSDPVEITAEALSRLPGEDLATLTCKSLSAHREDLAMMRRLDALLEGLRRLTGELATTGKFGIAGQINCVLGAHGFTGTRIGKPPVYSGPWST